MGDISEYVRPITMLKPVNALFVHRIRKQEKLCFVQEGQIIHQIKNQAVYVVNVNCIKNSVLRVIIFARIFELHF
jgi:hypothetical protein